MQEISRLAKVSCLVLCLPPAVRNALQNQQEVLSSDSAQIVWRLNDRCSSTLVWLPKAGLLFVISCALERLDLELGWIYASKFVKVALPGALPPVCSAVR